MNVRCLFAPFWWVSGGFLKGVWKVSETCLKMCLEGGWKVSGRPTWTCLAPFGSGIYLLVSDCCLNCVWRVSGKCMCGVGLYWWVSEVF